MKLKYLLRGAGLGIFAAGLIAFLVTLGGNKMSDEEVIKRAKELGYASEEEVLAKINAGEVVQLTGDTPGTETSEGNRAVSEEILPDDVKTSEDTSEEKTSETKTSEEKSSEEKASEDAKKAEEEAKKAEEEAKKKAEEEEAKKKAEEEAKKKAEEEEAKKKAEEEAKKKAEEEEAKKKAEEEAKKQQATGEMVTITVKSGDYSDTVAKACEAAGLVKSASDFDKYLCSTNGYSGKIAVGDHKIAKGSDYETIAKALCSH